MKKTIRSLKKRVLALILLAVLIIPAFLTATPIAAGSPPPANVNFPVTIRDFLGVGSTPVAGYTTHPDFEYTIQDDRGMLQNTLGADQKPAYASVGSTPTTHGKTSFDQWYNDTPGVNLSKVDYLQFTWDGSKYVYSNSSFFPIDGQLLGNYLGYGHNFHFTMEMHSKFTYRGGEVFNFTGDDDVWVFINNQLVIDLGGVHGAESASVALDNLGLTKGNDYNLDLFFAERHTTESNFRAETTILLQPVPIATTSTILDFGSIYLTEHVQDTAFVKGTGPMPTGQITFEVSIDGAVSFVPYGGVKTLVDGSALSDPYTPEKAGTYYFRAIYSGDSIYQGSQSGDKDEPLIVSNPAPPVPELPAGVLLGLGLAGIAVFTLFRKNQASKGIPS